MVRICMQDAKCKQALNRSVVRPHGLDGGTGKTPGKADQGEEDYCV